MGDLIGSPGYWLQALEVIIDDVWFNVGNKIIDQEWSNHDAMSAKWTILIMRIIGQLRLILMDMGHRLMTYAT